MKTYNERRPLDYEALSRLPAGSKVYVKLERIPDIKAALVQKSTHCFVRVVLVDGTAVDLCRDEESAWTAYAAADPIVLQSDGLLLALGIQDDGTAALVLTTKQGELKAEASFDEEYPEIYQLFSRPIVPSDCPERQVSVLQFGRERDRFCLKVWGDDGSEDVTQEIVGSQPL